MVVLTLTLVSDETGVIAVAKVQPTDPVNILQASILNALQIPAHSQDLKHNGVSLNWNTTISASGLADGDLIVVHRRVQPRAPTAPTTQQSATPRNALLEGIRANPTLMEQLRIQNPSLHQRVLNDDSSALMELMPFMRASGGQPRQRQPQQRRPPQQPARSTFDPMSADGQKAIEERIKQENIMNNMEAAWEHNPESFGRMPRLLIKCTVNGVRGVPALVDT